MAIRFFQSKRVLVTGGDGFVGSHLCKRLISEGAEVSAFVRRLELTALLPFQRELKSILAGDISDEKTPNEIRELRPQIIFHLAVEGDIRTSIEHPVRVSRTNVGGTLNVLEAARSLQGGDFERLIFCSTCAVYGSRSHRVVETDAFMPCTPYAASKAAADLFCQSYFKTYRLPVAIARLYNVYGPGQKRDVIPLFISWALRNQDIPLEGGGVQTRDFVYVDDIVEACLVMGSDPRAVGETVNFGTGRDISIRELAEKIIRIAGSSSRTVDVPQRPGQEMRVCTDPAKAVQLFGWNSRTSIDEGLSLTVPWYRKS